MADHIDIYLLLQKILRKINCLSDTIGDTGIGLTTDSPPVSTPSGTDSLVLVNQSTQEIWIWDGDSWEISSRPPAYKVYTAHIIWDVDINPISVTVFENTLGFDITWTVGDVGELWTQEGLTIDPDNVTMFISPTYNVSGVTGNITTTYVPVVQADHWEVDRFTPGDGPTSDAGSNFYIEIRVYQN